MTISDIKLRYGAIDFKFVNSGDATAVLHKFSLEILEYQLDLTPVLAYSYNRLPSMTYRVDAANSGATSLEVQVNNNGWGDAMQFTAHLTNPILKRLLPPSKLAFRCAAVTSGGKATFTLKVEDIDLQALKQMKIQRKATLAKSLAAMTSIDMTLLRDEDFNLFLSNLERSHVRDFLYSDNNYREADRSQWLYAYIAERGNEYLPIRLDMEVRYLDQYGNHQSTKAVAQSVQATSLMDMASKSGAEYADLDDLVREGVLWIGAEGFRFDTYAIAAEAMESTEVYSVILDPESNKRDYQISRSIAPGEADRFHILLVPTKSGTFTLQLSFNVNRTDLVTSDPISVSLERLRNTPLPPRLMDGASFQLRNGRLELGGDPKWSNDIW